MIHSPVSLSNFSINLPVVVRHATLEDLPLLEWDDHMWAFRRLFRQTYEESREGRRLMLIADVNGFPVGRVFVQVAPGNFNYADGYSRGYLYSLHVLPVCQGRGIGTELVKSAEVALRRLHFQWATIAVATENVRARQLYERLGYVAYRREHSRWSYVDPDGCEHYVNETCWALKKRLRSQDRN